MKKIISAISIFCVMAMFLSIGNAFANDLNSNTEDVIEYFETTKEQNEKLTSEADNETGLSGKLTLSIYIENVYNLKPQNIVFGLYSETEEFLYAAHSWVSDTDKSYELTFKLPEQNIGKVIYLKCFSGATTISFAGAEYKTDEFIPINAKDAAEAENYVYFSAIPLSSKEVTAFANGWELYFENPAKLVNDVCMIPVSEYLKALRMSDAMEYDEKSGRIEIEANYHKVVFYVNGNDMYADGKVTYSDTTPLLINKSIYVPFRFLVEGLGGTISADMENDKLNVKATFERVTPNKSEAKVAGITSRTDYLIWVSKSDFKVTLFKKKNGMWREEANYLCSIGAPNTPTIEGQFEYFSKEKSWDYPTYYVGPIMRFYSGYALHSTLLKYNGTSADGRLGKKISHGCVRLAPADINYLVDVVPLYTKVYVTA